MRDATASERGYLQRVLNFAAVLTRRPGTLGWLSLVGLFVVGFAGTYVPNPWRWFVEIPVGAFVVIAIFYKVRGLWS